ncbi:hypothetical protein C8Q77DRAFT_1120639 [Trametes polyzona]|nr:hypothetical protein C8Q77DRAFT_1120639 [Trametes polyzona]
MSLAGSEVPQFPSLDNSLGAWLLGTFAGTLLQGVVIYQTYRYFALYPKDALYLKIWVIAVLFLETVNTALTMHTSYTYLVTNYFNPTIMLGAPIWSMALLPVPGSIAAVVSQCFFARRVYMLGRKFRPIVAIAILCYLLFIGFYTTITIKTFQVRDFQDFLKFSWMASAGSSLMMVGDFLLTFILIYYLHVNRTGMTRTDSLLDVLIYYFVGTGLLICIFNVLNVVFALAFPKNLIYTAISIILTKLYANSFLVALNMREWLGHRQPTVEVDTNPFGSNNRYNSRRSPAQAQAEHKSTLKFAVGSQGSVTTTQHAPPIELKMVPEYSRDEEADVVHHLKHRGPDESQASFSAL